mmetsp:Transcript_136758/g.354644  ORF Transcript_136758/g.354644 Transcript_136758/m.354644 type:complete len:457 (+) Transcript_136758:1204-2574(+)
MPASRQRLQCSHSLSDSTFNLLLVETARRRSSACGMEAANNLHNASADPRRPRALDKLSPQRRSGLFGRRGSAQAGKVSSKSCQDNQGSSSFVSAACRLLCSCSKWAKIRGKGRPSTGCRTTHAMRSSCSAAKTMSSWRPRGFRIDWRASATEACPVSRRSTAATAEARASLGKSSPRSSCGAAASISSIRRSLQKRFTHIFCRWKGLDNRAACCIKCRNVTPFLPCCANSGQTCQTGVSSPTLAPLGVGFARALKRQSTNAEVPASSNGINVLSLTGSLMKPMLPNARLHDHAPSSRSTATCAPTRRRAFRNASSCTRTASCNGDDWVVPELGPPALSASDRDGVTARRLPAALSIATRAMACRRIGSAKGMVTLSELQRPWSNEMERCKNKNTPGMLSIILFGSSFFLPFLVEHKPPDVFFLLSDWACFACSSSFFFASLAFSSSPIWSNISYK